VSMEAGHADACGELRYFTGLDEPSSRATFNPSARL
jgi:hypothetical protein